MATKQLKTAKHPFPLPLRLGPRPALFLSRFFWAAGPVLGFFLVERLNYNHPFLDLTPLQIALNLALYYLIAGGVYLLVGRRNLSCGISTALFWGIAMANHYVISFRGRTIFPGDLLALKTAFNVAGGYSYLPDQAQWYSIFIIAAFLLVLLVLPRQHGRSPLRLRSVLPCSLAGIAFLAVFFCTGFLAQVGIEPSMWTTTGNGFVLNFSVCLRYSRVAKPEGYGAEALEAISAALPSDVPAAGGGGPRPVNLIVVMNESFSDLSVLGDLPMSGDPLPFWHSLTEDTVRGYAYASVFGGTTANSEYEFLTGNSTAFLPAGTVPFHMNVKEGSASLVAQMKALGYTGIAAHPYLSSGWNRVAVYRDLGFERVLFQQDFQDVSYLRNYITDRADFENVVRLYEEKQPGEPMFIFNVTMQNHSGYGGAWADLAPTVTLDGEMAGRFDTVDKYLSLSRETDGAFEYLIDYFAAVDEETMILMFGDHQPQVATNFYTEMLGGAPALGDAQKQYKVPFLIWANYDIPERDGMEISLSYLSALLMDTANLPMTGYQKFLTALQEEVPAMNANGFLGADGVWQSSAGRLAEEARQGLNAYQMLQYNEVYEGRENRLEDFFFLPEE